MVYRHVRRKADRATSHPTRERLIDTAVEVLGESGIDAFDVSEVLRRAEVTTGALYHHFRDMPELLELAIARRFPTGVSESLTQLRQGFEATKTLAEYQEAMRQLTEVSQDPARQERRVERAHFLALAFSSESLRELIGEQQRVITAELTETLALVQERGWIRRDLDPKAVAVFIQAYTLGRIIDDVSPDPVDPQAWNHLINTVMAKALAEPEQSE
jgi:AcrR family transcriptional regulator